MIKLFCQQTGVSEAAIKSRIRTQEVCAARAVLCYKMRQGGATYHEIGKQVGRSHSDALHCVRQVEAGISVLDALICDIVIKTYDIKFNYNKMSTITETISITPPSGYFGGTEALKTRVYVCPCCNGRGGTFYSKHDAELDKLGELKPCRKCEGTGKVIGEIKIEWKAVSAVTSY